MRKRLLLAATLLAPLVYAQDVHIRVDPSAPPAAPGNEDRTVFPTIQNALDHHPWPGPGGRGRVPGLPPAPPASPSRHVSLASPGLVS